MIQGVIGVMLFTDNVDRLGGFYRDVVGMKPRSSRPGRISFGNDEVRININPHDQVHGAAKDPHRIILNLGTDDINADYERLRANGVTFVRPPEKEGWGGYTATFRDPDGNLVNILQTA